MARASPIAVRIPFAVVPKRSASGVVLIATLFLLTLLMIIAMSGLVLSRIDLFISRNLLTGTQALWIARAGVEVGKNWLQMNLPGSALPVTLGPTPLADGTYTATIVALGDGRYRVTAVGVGPERSRRIVAETVQLPDFTPLGVVTSVGDGLHADFDDARGGTGRRIPDFSIDGRNHASDGSLSLRCPAIAPFAVTQASARDNLTDALAMLKREVVVRANSFCLADGSSAGGPCTPGLAWVRGSGALPRFTSGLCVAADPACFLNLDLAAPTLRALAHPADLHLPHPPNDRGPFSPGAPVQPFVRLLSATEQTRLQTALRDIVTRINELPADSVLSIATSVTAGAHTYGTFAHPRVTVVEDGGGALDVRGGAVVDGAGVLLIPRVLRLMNATLNWVGLVLIIDDGDLRVEDPAACGQILGAVIVRDDAALDRKFDLDLVQASESCPPFAVNYSCEAVSRALAILMRTVSWIEQSDG